MIERELSVGDFRRLILDRVQALLEDRTAEEDLRSGRFVKRDPTPLLRPSRPGERQRLVAVLAATLRADHPGLTDLVDRTLKLVDRALIARTATELMDVHLELLAVHGHGPDAGGPDAGIFVMRADADRVWISAGRPGDGRPDAGAVARDPADELFVLAVTKMLSRRRRLGTRLSPDEATAVDTAGQLLDRGVSPAAAYQPIGVCGFRRFQTALSVADPGAAHVQVTCRGADLTRGLVVHVEHIDRDQEVDREKVEPYRMPAALDAARVRLHTGADAPCSVFIGRPIFESGSFARDLLKTVHLVSGAITAMFMIGVADCKLGLEHMTAAEAVRFMRAVVGNVARDPCRQTLTAAFNLNVPMVDDRGDATRAVSDPLAVASLGIELARAGGFDRIAWDGSANTIPSVPVVDQLPFPRLLDLVHHAHETGLETYISAGLRPAHMRAATESGVGGVGMGTSLHLVDRRTKLMGPLRASLIREALDVRDASAVRWAGRGAGLLARLDRLAFEKVLPRGCEAARVRLYEALRTKDRAGVLGLCRQLVEFEQLPADTDHPVIERAGRLVAWSPRRPLAATGMDRAAWRAFVAEVRGLVEARDVTQLRELLA